MNTGTLTHVPTGETFSVYDVTDTSYKSKEIKWGYSWVKGQTDVYSLNDKPVKIYDTDMSTKGDITSAVFQYV